MRLIVVVYPGAVMHSFSLSLHPQPDSFGPPNFIMVSKTFINWEHQAEWALLRTSATRKWLY